MLARTTENDEVGPRDAASGDGGLQRIGRADETPLKPCQFYQYEVDKVVRYDWNPLARVGIVVSTQASAGNLSFSAGALRHSR